MIFVYRYQVLCRQNTFNINKFARIYILLVIYTGIQSALCCVTVEDPNDDHWAIISKNKLFAEDTPTMNLYDAVSFLNFISKTILFLDQTNSLSSYFSCQHHLHLLVLHNNLLWLQGT